MKQIQNLSVSRREFGLGVAGAAAATAALGPGGVALAQADPQDLARLAGGFKAGVASAMTTAAAEAGVPILTEQIAIATRGDIFLASALVAPPEGRAPAEDEQQQLFFSYMSYSPGACGREISTGFYTIQRANTDKVPEPDEEGGVVQLPGQLVDYRGEVVREITLNSIKVVGEPTPPAPPPALMDLPNGEQVAVEAIIRNLEATNMGTWCTTTHKLRCHSSGVWYWTWYIECEEDEMCVPVPASASLY